MTIEQTPKLDLRQLRKAGALKDGLKIELRWQYHGREIVSTVGMILDSEKMTGAMMANGQSFGLKGFRLKSGSCGWWLVCPACGALRFVLMFNDCNGRIIGCRGCLKLKYRAQGRRGCIGEYQEAAKRAEVKAEELRAQGHPRKAARWQLRAWENERKDEEKFCRDAAIFLARLNRKPKRT